MKEIGATITGVNIRDLKRVVLPVPYPEEQAKIASYLIEESNSTDSLIGRAKREIELLREYHTRLTADVVTGKIDVREAAANLPDEVGEPDQFEGPEVIAGDDEEGEGADLDATIEENEA